MESHPAEVSIRPSSGLHLRNLKRSLNRLLWLGFYRRLDSSGAEQCGAGGGQLDVGPTSWLRHAASVCPSVTWDTDESACGRCCEDGSEHAGMVTADGLAHSDCLGGLLSRVRVWAPWERVRCSDFMHVGTLSLPRRQCRRRVVQGAWRGSWKLTSPRLGGQLPHRTKTPAFPLTGRFYVPTAAPGWEDTGPHTHTMCQGLSDHRM